MAAGLVRLAIGPWFGWLGEPARRWWSIPLVVGLLAVPALLPFDGPMARYAAAHPPRGDIRRELEAIQQFGQGVSLVVIMSAIALLDPANRRRLLDLAAAAASTGALVLALKMVIGRPRPRPNFGDPLYFLGPFGEYPVKEGVGVRHAWEFWAGISSDLWSMPSSHTAYAVVMAIFLWRVYPRIRPLAIVLASIVGLARVWLGAHYPTDVLVGALAAASLAPRAIDRFWGQALWGRVSAVLRAPTHGERVSLPTDPRGDSSLGECVPHEAPSPAESNTRPPTTSRTEPETERPPV